jgi:Ni,Fe-hydrogenase III small subunit
VCPTGAINFRDQSDHRTVTLDLGKCVFCGLCADADPAIRLTHHCELAAGSRESLRHAARYQLDEDGGHQRFLEGPASPSTIREHHSAIRRPQSPIASAESIEAVGRPLQAGIHSVLGRSLHIREVDAGSCNGCEVEIHGLNSPVYDIERFGIHFVASPRHADMLLVTGPVTRNMELALRKTYDATPEPRLVVAVGTCGCSGGVFGVNYATCGAVDTVIPVDVYVPGCPPNPHALLHGILLAIGRFKRRSPSPNATAEAAGPSRGARPVSTAASWLSVLPMPLFRPVIGS